ncbi:unnamed protein product [Nippostrongylus brasiliensis]|uniref:UPF0505 protein C16orf62 (inferred by orthology to a human protein) n=1 Tax=Nippostrongylus brasiliensis TaxID=27835 RepID=A0A0N4YM57_NIPBR|nr:unnamed protein product [Nippostrongylus brasiliensis]
MVRYEGWSASTSRTLSIIAVHLPVSKTSCKEIDPIFHAMDSPDEVLWKFRYPSLSKGRPLDSVPVIRHPLQAKPDYPSKELKRDIIDAPKYNFVDPLGATADEDISTGVTRVDLDAVDDISPKKEQVLDNTLETKTKDRPVRDVDLPDFERWASKRAQILSLQSTGMESATATLSSSGGTLPAKFSVSNMTKYRLQMLEDMSGLRKLSDISQNEFVSHVNELRECFLTAWNNNKRVESVQVITELARLLSAPTTPPFFPVQWILVTDIIDLFGKLVYDRLFSKANEERKSNGESFLASDFVSSDIPPTTVDIAKNWFAKVDDIKEVVPRFYVETTLIGCLRFVDNSHLSTSLLRLAAMVEKFPHPLSAAYARAYICKIAMILDPTNRAPHWKALNDWMQSSKLPVCAFCSCILFKILNDNSKTDFVTPALEWVVQCVSYGATTVEDLNPLWEYCKKPDQQCSLIHAFLVGVPLKYLLNHCVNFCELVSDNISLNLISMKITSGGYFSMAELSKLCDVILQKLSAVKDPSEQLVHLAAIIEHIVEYGGQDFYLLFETKPFTDLLDYVRDEPHGSRCARAVLTAVIRMFEVGGVEDYIIAEQIVEQCGVLSKSIRPETISDEIGRYSRRIRKDTSHSFATHAHSSIRAMDVLRAILANLFVTIPSLHDPVMRLQYFLRTIYLGLLANSPSQTEALLGSCLETLDQLAIPAADCVPLFTQFLAVLVFVPDVPRKPMLHIFSEFVDLLLRKKWPTNSEAVQGDVWMLCLHYLWAVLQPDFSTRFLHVASNDVYYGSSAEYRAAVAQKVDIVMQQVLALVEAQTSTKPTVALALLEFVVMRMEIEGPVVKLVTNLLKRCARSGHFERRIALVIDDLTVLSETNEPLRQVLVKMKLL